MIKRPAGQELVTTGHSISEAIQDIVLETEAANSFRNAQIFLHQHNALFYDGVGHCDAKGIDRALVIQHRA